MVQIPKWKLWGPMLFHWSGDLDTLRLVTCDPDTLRRVAFDLDKLKVVTSTQ